MCSSLCLSLCMHALVFTLPIHNSGPARYVLNYIHFYFAKSWTKVFALFIQTQYTHTHALQSFQWFDLQVRHNKLDTSIFIFERKPQGHRKYYYQQYVLQTAVYAVCVCNVRWLNDYNTNQSNQAWPLAKFHSRKLHKRCLFLCAFACMCVCVWTVQLKKANQKFHIETQS